jgi:hypothetical protein
MLIFEPIPVDDYNVTSQPDRLMVNRHTKLRQWDEEDEEYQPVGPYQRNTFSNIVSLSQGYFYASFVNESSNFTICDGNYTVVKASADYFGAQFGNLGNVTNMTNALNAVAEIMSTTYPLTYSCFYGGLEAENTFQGYVSSAASGQTLLFNLFNSMGPLYDVIYYLRGWQSQDKIDLQTNDEVKFYWYRLGAYYGILTNLLLVS